MREFSPPMRLLISSASIGASHINVGVRSTTIEPNSGLTIVGLSFPELTLNDCNEVIWVAPD